MATYNGTEWANRVAVPAAMNKAYVDGGRVRIKFFSFTTPSGLLINDVVNICVLPAGALLLNGFIQFTAMGAGATCSIGPSATPTKYLNAGSVAAAGTLSFLNTAALNFAAVETTDEPLIMTMSGAAWASAQSVNGYVMYVKD